MQITVSESSNSELLQGVRGAGTAFGVVTEVTFQLYVAPQKKLPQHPVCAAVMLPYYLWSLFGDLAVAAATAALRMSSGLLSACHLIMQCCVRV